MKRIEAKIIHNESEDSDSEPDHASDTWLIQAKLSEDLQNWENAQVRLLSKVGKEVVELSMTSADHLIIRTHGQSPLQKGDILHLQISV